MYVASFATSALAVGLAYVDQVRFDLKVLGRCELVE